MITIESITCCVIDGKPIGESWAYQFVKKLHGERVASKITYQRKV